MKTQVNDKGVLYVWGLSEALRLQSSSENRRRGGGGAMGASGFIHSRSFDLGDGLKANSGEDEPHCRFRALRFCVVAVVVRNR